MCGIFGAIGQGFSNEVIRSLALINKNRGGDATGFVGSDGNILKGAKDSLDFLQSEKFDEYEKTWENMWFLLGHTRAGTRGAKNKDDNAHPFQYGKYIGIHNGCVEAPWSYDVDSMYLWDSLNKANGNYEKAWAEISGWWALAWTDLENVWMQSNNQEVSLTVHKNIIYFSSDFRHLKAVTGGKKIVTLKSGSTLKFDRDATCQEMPEMKFSPKKKGFVRQQSGFQGFQQDSHTSSYSTNAQSRNYNHYEDDDGELHWWEKEESFVMQSSSKEIPFYEAEVVD